MSSLPAETIMEWHAKWCRHLEAYCKTQGLSMFRPSLRYSSRVTPTAAFCMPELHVCSYNISYFLALQAEYEETVMHEVCHSAAMHLYPKGTPAHGNEFLFLCREVCGYVNHSATHDYDWRAIKAYESRAKSMMLQLKMQLISGAHEQLF